MPQLTMYPGQVNSPATELATQIDDTQTTIQVLDASILPDAPNIATIGVGENAETILYTAKDNSTNELTVTRGFQGGARVWGAGTKIRRLFTAYDWDSIRQNHETHLAENVLEGGSPHGIFYEEGIFVPRLEVGTTPSGNYVVQKGSYVIRGNEVTIYIEIETDSRDDSVGTLQLNIKGLPVVPIDTSAMTIGMFGGLTMRTNTSQIVAHVTSNGLVYFRFIGDGSKTIYVLRNTEISESGCTIILSGTYKIS